MSETPNDLHYTASHEWVRVNDDGSVTVGITDHAQDQLGDVVFVETPEIDAEVSAGDAVAVIESVKAASDTYAPVSGTITDANAALTDTPELVNDAPYTEGWLYTIQPSEPEQVAALLDADAYLASLEA